MRRAVLAVLPLLLVVTGCHGRSPLAPSGTSSGGGATINGSIVSSTSSGTMARTSSYAMQPNALAGVGTTVSVVGVGLSAAVEKNGRFSIRGVPPGAVTLHFGGTNVDADLELDPIESTETIDLSLSLDSSSVTIESERRSLGHEQQLEGRIESLPSAASFVVVGQLVTTTPETRFYDHGAPASFTDLAVGYRVHVKGQTAGQSVVASVVMLQNTHGSLPDGEDADDAADDDDDGGQQVSASVEGTLLSKAGSDLVVGGTTVHTDVSTRVHRHGDVQDLSVLQIGMRLHVVGVRQPDGSINARTIQIKGDAPGAPFEIEGSMGGMKGTCPSLTFGISGYSIVTNSATTFTPACSTFKSGTKVTVKGVVQADGSIVATTVTK